ncbi:GlxA family transcriptional regulator [Mesorhizobium sp. 2RAF21]|uniref:GlxA family transcriptional regulator n=1 Tax=Mesorhizobium sp. 2RAF21 TaxID=3232995 RepID=UPI003F9D31F4
MFVDVVVLPRFSMMSLAATIEPLRAANRAAGRELYRWRLVSLDGADLLSSSGVRIGIDARFEHSDERDMLFVVAAFNARSMDRRMVAQLRRAARQDTVIVGVEAGAWVLARCGLLDGYSATTHWEDLEEFSEAYPAIKVVGDRFVMDRLRWTAGGAAPTLDMMLTFIRLQHGPPTALDVANIFIYSQSFSGSSPQKYSTKKQLNIGDKRILFSIMLMEENLDVPLPIPLIAKKAGISLRSLQMKFMESLSQSPQEYYLTLRLAAAMRKLEQTPDTVTEAAAAYGFGSASAFARAFRRKFGMSPSLARRISNMSLSGASGPTKRAPVSGNRTVSI